jgi:hypothetical protein
LCLDDIGAECRLVDGDILQRADEGEQRACQHARGSLLRPHGYVRIPGADPQRICGVRYVDHITHRRTARQAMLDGEAEELTRKAVELAKGGDMAALRLCLDRILPPRKDRPVAFVLPAVAGPNDAAAAMSSILDAVSSGEITPGEGAEVAKLIDSYVRAVEATEMNDRLTRLERAAQK